MTWQRYKTPIVLGSVSIILIAVSLVLLVKTTQTPTPIQFIDAPAGLVVGPGAPDRVSVNSALAEDLEALPGIGPVTAKKVIDNRPYQTLEDLVNKKAMGQALFNKLKDQLTL